MKILFKECDTLLNVRLDNMMLVYRKSYPDFILNIPTPAKSEDGVREKGKMHRWGNLKI